MGSPRRVTDGEGRTRCSRCGEFKESTVANFTTSPMCRGGITAVCRACAARRLRRWRSEHPEQAARRRDRERVVARERAREKAIKYNERAPYQERARILRSGIRERSKSGVIPADLNIFTVNYLTEWLRRQPACECCGVTFAVARRFTGQKCDQSPSLDRIVPSLGYVVGNVALLCWRCNNLKRDSTASELMTVARWFESKMVAALATPPAP